MNPIVGTVLGFRPRAVFFALTVLGWGGMTPFFLHPALTTLVISGFVLAGVGFFADGNLSAGQREDRSTRWNLAALGLITLLPWLRTGPDRPHRVLWAHTFIGLSGRPRNTRNIPCVYDFLVTEPLHVGQKNRGSVLRWQRFEALAHFGVRDLLEQGLRVAGVAQRRILAHLVVEIEFAHILLIHEFGFPGLARVEERVHEDAMEPCPNTGPLLKGTKGPPRLEYDFLDQV